MEYRIVVDSCGELTDEMKKSGIYKTASLSMEVDGVHIQDDESFDQADFLKRVAESSECPEVFLPITGEIYGAVSLRSGAGLCRDAFGRTERFS